MMGTQTKTNLHPATAFGLKQPYTETNITKKNTNKEYLLDQLGVSHAKKTLLVAVVVTKDVDVLSKEEREMFFAMKEALTTLPSIAPVFVFSVLNDEAKKMSGIYPAYESSTDGITNVELLSGADAFVFIEKTPVDVESSMERILCFGGIIVSYTSRKLPTFIQSYNPFTEQGSAFLFDIYSPWAVFAQVMSVYNVFQFSYDWNTVRKRAMSTIHS